MSFLYDLFQTGLVFLYSALPHWGAVIIASALLVRMALAPIQLFTTRQQLRLKQIQPELESLRKRHTKDLPKYVHEVRQAKEAAGVKTGWLIGASILQSIVFIGMFGALTTGTFLSASDLFWIPSLASPDPVYVLPILMGLLSYFQLNGMLANAPVRIPVWIIPMITSAFTSALPAGALLFSLVNSAVQMTVQSLIERWL